MNIASHNPVKVFGLALSLGLSAPTSFSGEIHQAVEAHDLGKVKTLLQANPSLVHATNDDHRASLPIHIAAARDDTNMLALLLEYGAKLEATNDLGFTALHSATWVPADKAARFLIERGADVNARKAFKTRSPLHFAAASGSAGIVELLLDRGAVATQSYDSPLDEAAKNGHESAVKLLLAHKADINGRGGDAQATPLIEASSRGWTNVVRLLLENKADINAQTKDGYSALMQAARYGRAAVAELLVQHQANVDLEDDTGKTALGWALQNDAGKARPDIAELLKRHGATKLTSNIRRTSIQQAVSMGDLERVKMLLNQKPELAADKDSHFGETPLHLAAGIGNTEICRLLIDKKADVNAKDVGGETPLHAAAKGGRLAVIELLLANQADPLAVDSEGRTVLHMAALGGNARVVAILLENKVDVNAKEKSGLTALDIANGLGRKAAAEVLRKHGAK